MDNSLPRNMTEIDWKKNSIDVEVCQDPLRPNWISTLIENSSQAQKGGPLLTSKSLEYIVQFLKGCRVCGPVIKCTMKLKIILPIYYKRWDKKKKYCGGMFLSIYMCKASE